MCCQVIVGWKFEFESYCVIGVDHWKLLAPFGTGLVCLCIDGTVCVFVYVLCLVDGS